MSSFLPIHCNSSMKSYTSSTINAKIYIIKNNIVINWLQTCLSDTLKNSYCKSKKYSEI